MLARTAGPDTPASRTARLTGPLCAAYTGLPRLQGLRTTVVAAACEPESPLDTLTRLEVRPLKGKPAGSARAEQAAQVVAPVPWQQLRLALPNLVALHGVTEKVPLCHLRALTRLSSVRLGLKCAAATPDAPPQSSQPLTARADLAKCRMCCSDAAHAMLRETSTLSSTAET